MIIEDAIHAWRAKAPWRDIVQVEQDLILSGMLQRIYSDPFLASRLAFRGGTCLNKLFWAESVRYSEDLDFVQMEKEKIGQAVKSLRNVLDPLFEKKPSWEAKQGGFRLHYRFKPTLGDISLRKIKIEINTREQFALAGYLKKPFQLDSMWHSGKAEVTTYTLEELLATKVRALYQRRKGRDLFDLWKGQELKPNWSKVVAMFLKYMEWTAKPVDDDLLLNNLAEKLKDSRFTSDLGPLLIGDKPFDIQEGAEFVAQNIFSLVPKSKTRQRVRSR